MFWKKIKEKFRNAVKDAIAIDDYIYSYGSYDDCDVDVKIARHNYKMYQEDLNRRQQELIEKWCKEIRKVSRDGGKYIDTDGFVVDDDWNKILYLVNAGQVCDFPSNSSIQYFQEYFEERGFNVTRIEIEPHKICKLKISWLD